MAELEVDDGQPDNIDFHGTNVAGIIAGTSQAFLLQTVHTRVLQKPLD